MKTQKINKEEIKDGLLSQEWKDFFNYPKRDSDIFVCAEGYDTKEKKPKRLFFMVTGFNIIDFPDKDMVRALNKHHCKWRYRWVPSMISNIEDYS